MKLEVFDTIGLPQLIIGNEREDGFAMTVTVPKEVMAKMARVCARRLLHDGTTEQRQDMVNMANEIIEAFGLFKQFGVE